MMFNDVRMALFGLLFIAPPLQVFASGGLPYCRSMQMPLSHSTGTSAAVGSDAAELARQDVPISASVPGNVMGLAGHPVIVGNGMPGDRAALVISPDTGPLHMSVALNRPVISLIGYSNPKRVGPYRKFRDLMIDSYGEPGEDYPISMENRTGRLPRIAVRDVLDKVELWKNLYSAQSRSSSGRP